MAVWEKVAAQYSNPAGSRRPSVVPSVIEKLANLTGKDEATIIQRRESTAESRGGSRRPSIAGLVTDYLHKQEV